jgi:DNA-binding transcriptional ArsR family regulator
VEAYGIETLGALGDPTRRAIFECLVKEPMAVGQLAEKLPVSRPAVSQHLKVLKQVGLVNDQADGTKRVYRVDPAGVMAIRGYLDAMWSQALAGFQQSAQQIALSESQSPEQQSQEGK